MSRNQRQDEKENKKRYAIPTNVYLRQYSPCEDDPAEPDIPNYGICEFLRYKQSVDDETRQSENHVAN